MKVNVILYKSEFTDCSATVIRDTEQYDYLVSKGYIFISEMQERKFKELPKSLIINKQVDTLDKQIDEKFEEINQLKSKKQELFSLEHKYES